MIQGLALECVLRMLSIEYDEVHSACIAPGFMRVPDNFTGSSGRIVPRILGVRWVAVSVDVLGSANAEHSLSVTQRQALPADSPLLIIHPPRNTTCSWSLPLVALPQCARPRAASFGTVDSGS